MPNNINIQSCYYALKSLIDTFNKRNNQNNHHEDIVILIQNIFNRLFLRTPTEFEIYLYGGLALKYPPEIVEKIILSEVRDG